MAHVTRDNVAGVRPGRVLVRIIIGPHAIVATPPGEQPSADIVIEESRVDLPLEIFAGWFSARELPKRPCRTERLRSLGSDSHCYDTGLSPWPSRDSCWRRTR